MIESSILKKSLTDKVYFNKVKQILDENIFENPANAEIFKLIKNHYETYNNLPKIEEIAISANNLNNIEIKKEIAKSLKEINSSQELDQQFLLDKTLQYAKDQLYTQGLIAGSDYVNTKDPKYIQKSKELIEKSQKLCIDLDLGLDYNDIEQRIEYYHNDLKGIKFKRFKAFNNILGPGFLPGTMSVICAASGVGKSLFMSSAIADLLSENKNILLISMEMSSNEFVKRIDSDFLNLEINKLDTTNDEIIRSRFSECRSNSKFYTKAYPAGTFSVSNLEALIDMYKSHDITFDIIFLDYLGIMKSDRVSPNIGLYPYIKSIAEEVRGFSVKYNIPVITCSQLNRSSVNNVNADNAAISDSMGTVQTADFICFLLQDESMKENNRIIFKTTKNRFSGKTKSFEMNIDYNYMRFYDTEIIDMSNFNDEKEKVLDNMVKEYTRNEIQIAQKIDKQNSIENFFNDLEVK